MDVDRHGRNVLHALAESSSFRSSSDEGSHDNSNEETASRGSKDEILDVDDSSIVEMISQVHKSHPMAYMQTDCYGMIPLQLAVVSGASPSIIEALVQCDPGSVQVKWTEHPSHSHGEGNYDDESHNKKPLSIVVSGRRGEHG